MKIVCLQMKNALRLNLKRTSNQSQEPQMVQIQLEKQSKRLEVEPQTHLKPISRTSNGSNSIGKATKTP